MANKLAGKHVISRDRFRESLKAKNLSIRQIEREKLIDRNEKTIRRYANGYPISSDMLNELCILLDASPYYLCEHVGNTGEIKKYPYFYDYQLTLGDKPITDGNALEEAIYAPLEKWLLFCGIPSEKILELKNDGKRGNLFSILLARMLETTQEEYKAFISENEINNCK